MSIDLSDVWLVDGYYGQYLCEKSVTVMALEYSEAFDELTEKEKMYTYYLFKAIAAGWRVCYIDLP